MLDRADASAAELEQSVLRVFDQVAMLQNLAQTRAQMVEDGNTAGLNAIEQQIASVAPPDRFGILHVAVTGLDGVSAPPTAPDDLASLSRAARWPRPRHRRPRRRADDPAAPYRSL